MIIIRRSARGGPDPSFEDRVKMVQRQAEARVKRNTEHGAFHLSLDQLDAHVQHRERFITQLENELALLMEAWHHRCPIGSKGTVSKRHRCPARPDWQGIIMKRQQLARITSHDPIDAPRKAPRPAEHVPANHQWPGDGKPSATERLRDAAFYHKPRISRVGR